jgi:decaprenylphospho-beta-D-erythro-pentofuranosid-2-ulose 2-reductase
MSDAFGRPRRIAVLGASSEIAQAIVAKLQERGGVERVVRAGRGEEVEFDALRPETHAPALDALFAGPGDVDLFLVAVGLLGDQAEAERSPERAAELAVVNYAGLAGPLVDAGRRLAAQGHGTLVVLSSVAAQRVRRSNWVYGAAKAGLDGFARGLGMSLAGTGVRVLVVRPGFVRTRMTAGMKPLPLATTPGAVADAVVRALDEGKEVVWVPGIFRFVMWLVQLLPSRVVARL